MASTNENSSVKSRTHTLKRVLRVRAPKELAKYVARRLILMATASIYLKAAAQGGSNVLLT